MDLLGSILDFLKRPVERAFDESNRSRTAIAAGAVLGLIVAAVVMRARVINEPISNKEYWTFAGVLIAVITLLVTVLLPRPQVTREESEAAASGSLRQAPYDPPEAVKRPDGSAIMVSELKTNNPQPEQLDGYALLEGIRALVKQVEIHKPAFLPDLCIGVNAAGLIVATIISEKLHRGRCAVGFVATAGPDHELATYALPHPKDLRCLTEVPSILVCDDEVKKGNSIRNVIDFIRKRYARSDCVPNIYFAAVVASEVNGPIVNVADICEGRQGRFAHAPEYLPRFLAFRKRGKIASAVKNLVSLERPIDSHAQPPASKTPE